MRIHCQTLLKLLIQVRFAAVNLDSRSGGKGYSNVVNGVQEDDEARINFLKACLTKLGLKVSEDKAGVPSLSRLHLSSSSHTEVAELLEDLKEIITIEAEEEYIKGENDNFHIEKQSSRWSLHSLVKELPIIGSLQEQSNLETEGTVQDGIIDYNAITKRLVPHETEWPGSKETPYFNHHAFYANLRNYQNEKSSLAEEYGNILLYGEVVTSTNTILEKYKSSTCELNSC